MNPDLYLADLAEKPARLRAWNASSLWGFLAVPPPMVLLVGMGSSHFANTIAAARLRACGVTAVAELASSDTLPRLGPGAVIIAVSASAGSPETLETVHRLARPYIAVVNRPGPLADGADRVVWLDAGEERGGVACRSFQHTLAALLCLVTHLTAAPPPAVSLVADACEEILATQDEWLAGLSGRLLGPDGTYLVAPARRLSSAHQSALMLREGPRLPAAACETGDWSHIDVYLTKTLDYRMVLFAGSPWEAQLIDWTTQRRSTVVSIGGEVPGATSTLRYRHDDIDDVRLLTETLFVELVAGHQWRRQQAGT